MIDINNILIQALTAAVAEATKRLVERIAALETKLALETTLMQGDTLSPDDLVQVKQRIEALENIAAEYSPTVPIKPLLERIEEVETQLKCHANFDLTRMEQRIEALEQATPETPAAISAAAFVTYLDQQEWFWEKLTRKAGEAAESAVEEAINDHCSTYDHDDYDNVSSAVNDVDLDNVVTHDNLRDEIQRVLREVTISIDV